MPDQMLKAITEYATFLSKAGEIAYPGMATAAILLHAMLDGAGWHIRMKKLGIKDDKSFPKGSVDMEKFKVQVRKYYGIFPEGEGEVNIKRPEIKRWVLVGSRHPLTAWQKEELAQVEGLGVEEIGEVMMDCGQIDPDFPFQISETIAREQGLKSRFVPDYITGVLLKLGMGKGDLGNPSKLIFYPPTLASVAVVYATFLERLTGQYLRTIRLMKRMDEDGVERHHLAELIYPEVMRNQGAQMTERVTADRVALALELAANNPGQVASVRPDPQNMSLRVEYLGDGGEKAKLTVRQITDAQYDLG